MTEDLAKSVRLEGNVLTDFQGKLDVAQSHLSNLAQILGSNLRGADAGPAEVKTVSYGAKKLIVRTADGFCYVYDGNQGVCRFCDGVSDGET